MRWPPWVYANAAQSATATPIRMASFGAAPIETGYLTVPYDGAVGRRGWLLAGSRVLLGRVYAVDAEDIPGVLFELLGVDLPLAATADADNADGAGVEVVFQSAPRLVAA